MTHFPTDALSAAHTQREMDAIPQDSRSPATPEAGGMVSRAAQLADVLESRGRNNSLHDIQRAVAFLRAAPVGHDDMVEAYMAGAFGVHEEWLRAHAAGEAPPRGDPEFREAATDHADAYAARYLALPAAAQGQEGAVLSETQTSRGFQKVGFCDHYGVDCSIQKSSLATEHAIWIGADNLGLKRFPGNYTGWHDVDLGEVFPGQTIDANTRMHLTQDDVRAILPTLAHFAETGDVLAHPAIPASAETGLREAVVKHLAWMDAYLCKEDEVRSSTPRKVCYNSQDAADSLRAALRAQSAPVGGLSSAARDVLAERQRQISAEGWTPEHDDEHDQGEMVHAAACYAINAAEEYDQPDNCPPPAWPWAKSWWKPSTTRRDLEKAGALILAEIERIDRAALAAQEGEVKG